MKISAVWITKNEEGIIGRSIDSVKAVADELVVVDTGSNDGTAAEAEAHGARVVPFEWVNDFAAARNFALKQVSGDAVIILDADEWFDPALGKKDAAAIQRAFEQKNILSLTVPMTNVDLEMGLEIGVNNTIRIIRGKGMLHYVGAAHEHLVPTGGGTLTTMPVQGFNIQHTGYSLSQTRSKLKRNTEIMEAALKEGVAKGDEAALLHAYLVREQNGMGMINRSLEHLQTLMDNPAELREIMRRYVDIGVQLTHLSLLITEQRRDRVSRQQVDTVVIRPAIKIYADNPAGANLRVYADLFLDYNEEALLENLDEAVAKGDALLEKTNNGREEYLRANTHLLTAAGAAAWRRGRHEKAFEYATKALQQTEAAQYAETMALLLRCVKGLPLEDVAVFLDSILNTKTIGMQQTLLGSLRYEGFKDLYAHFMKKMLDAGRVKKADLWYMMIVLGNYAQAAESAWGARENTELADVQRAIFLAVVCGGGHEVYDVYKGDLGRYDGPLAYYLDHELSIGEFDAGILTTNYQLIAFAAGRITANNFVRSFTGVEEFVFRTQARYYLEAGLYREFLAEVLYNPQEEDGFALRVFAECSMMVGKFDDALGYLKNAMVGSVPGFELFNLLGALAERAGEGAVAEEATALRDNYLPLFEEWVDWRDVVNTGYIAETDGKKEKRTLAQMTQKQLLEMEGPVRLQPLPGVAEAAYAAAKVYEENGCQMAALNAYRWLVVLGEDAGDIHRRMAQVFLQAGNAELAKQLVD